MQTPGSAVLPTWLKENLQTPPIEQRVPFGRVLLPGEDWDEVEGPLDGDDAIFVEVEDWDDDIFTVDPEDHTDK